MTIRYRMATSETDAKVADTINAMLIAKAQMCGVHDDESDEAADARYKPYDELVQSLVEMRPDGREAWRWLIHALYVEDRGCALDENSPFFRALLGYMNHTLGMHLSAPDDEPPEFVPVQKRQGKPVDPLVEAFAKYVPSVEAFNDPTRPDRPNEESEALAEDAYREWEEKLEKPGEIQSIAGAHALVQYLAMDNKTFGQEAYNEPLARLVDFLGKRVQS